MSATAGFILRLLMSVANHLGTFQLDQMFRPRSAPDQDGPRHHRRFGRGDRAADVVEGRQGGEPAVRVKGPGEGAANAPSSALFPPMGMSRRPSSSAELKSIATRLTPRRPR